MERKHLLQEESYLSVAAARELYAAGDAAHDFDHVWRVTQLALQLAAAEGADPTVVRLAALLHDVPLPDAPTTDARATRQAHHLAAADYARTLLAAQAAPAALVDQVAHCIEAHRYRDQSIQPATLEAQCLYDADKLDSMGAIGVARAFAYAGAHGSRLWTVAQTAVPAPSAKPTGADYTPVHEFMYKLRHLQATLHTATARAWGMARHQRMVAFFEHLDAEMRLME